MKKAPQGPCNGLDPQKNPVETLIPGNLAQAIKKGSVSLSERKRVPKNPMVIHKLSHEIGQHL